MQLTPPRPQTASVVAGDPVQSRNDRGPAYQPTSRSLDATAEIHAYIAVRDRLLAEAEDCAAPGKLNRAWLANEFVLKCLEPTYSPYQAQGIPESEAARERIRYAAAKVRITELRARTGNEMANAAA